MSQWHSKPNIAGLKGKIDSLRTLKARLEEQAVALRVEAARLRAAADKGKGGTRGDVGTP